MQVALYDYELPGGFFAVTERVEADDPKIANIPTGTVFRCPNPACQCDGLTHRIGANVRPHFRHISGGVRGLTAPESDEHRRTKLRVQEVLSATGLRPVPEARIHFSGGGPRPNWRRTDVAGYCAGARVTAIEIQHSSMPSAAVLERTADLTAGDAAVLWLATRPRIGLPKCVNAAGLVDYAHLPADPIAIGGGSFIFPLRTDVVVMQHERVLLDMQGDLWIFETASDQFWYARSWQHGAKTRGGWKEALLLVGPFAASSLYVRHDEYPAFELAALGAFKKWGVPVRVGATFDVDMPAQFGSLRDLALESLVPSDFDLMKHLPDPARKKFGTDGLTKRCRYSGSAPAATLPPTEPQIGQ